MSIKHKTLLKWFDVLTKAKFCDCCGLKNPPVTTAGNQRVTLCCIEEKGFYGIPEAPEGYGSNGKSMTCYLQFPIKITFKWRSFRTYGMRR